MDNDLSINVLVAHEQPLIRAGLAAILGACGEMTVSLATGERPPVRQHVVVTDYQDGLRRLDLARMPQIASACRVLIVTQQDKEWDIRAALSAGVDGYLLQRCSELDLVAAVRALARGLRYRSPVLNLWDDNVARTGLTSRENDVLRLMARGCCNKLIARELGIGVATVKTHVKGLFDKLGATARTHAVVLATQRGIVSHTHFPSIQYSQN